jgi:hypothetical protein
VEMNCRLAVRMSRSTPAMWSSATAKVSWSFGRSGERHRRGSVVAGPI